MTVVEMIAALQAMERSGLGHLEVLCVSPWLSGNLLDSDRFGIKAVGVEPPRDPDVEDGKVLLRTERQR